MPSLAQTIRQVLNEGKGSSAKTSVPRKDNFTVLNSILSNQLGENMIFESNEQITCTFEQAKIIAEVYNRTSESNKEKIRKMINTSKDDMNKVLEFARKGRK